MRDIGKRDHGPKHSATKIGNQLQVDGVRHVVQAGNNQRRIKRTKESAEQGTERAGDAGVNDGGDTATEPPANGSQDKVGGHDGKQQAAERNDDHRDDLGRDLAEETLQEAKCNCGENRGDDLRLIANHIDLGKAKVPMRNLISRRAGNGIGVKKLPGDERQAQNDTEHRRATHLFGDRPTDAYWNASMEDRLANQP